MIPDPLPRCRALSAPAEGALAPLQVVRLPFLAHGLAPLLDPLGKAPAGNADHRPPTRAASDAAAAAHPATTRDARAPAPRAALGATTSTTFCPHRRGTVAVPKKNAKSLTKLGSGDYGFRWRGQNKARADGRTTEARASGHEVDANPLGPSQWVRTLTVSRFSTPYRNGRALARAPERSEFR